MINQIFLYNFVQEMNKTRLKFSIMKYRIFSFFIFAAVSFLLWATDGEIVINRPGQQHDHIEYYLPADAPQVFLDSEEMEIIIVGDGFSEYYVVDIVSQVTMQSVIYTQIGGYGDSIDISSLPDAYYRIVIQSSNNNVYEGYFPWEQE